MRDGTAGPTTSPAGQPPGGPSSPGGPGRLPPGVRARVALRSFLVQAAWNYRTLQGAGVAYALLPVLRHVHGEGPALEAAVARHAGHFNAHPYLASLALGSLARLEAEGADPEMIRRFRNALGGPLGALGDRLFWAAWLPLCAVVAVTLFWGGLGPFASLATFLVLYNAGHLGFRMWAFRQGWNAGSALGGRLRDLGLSAVATRLEGWLAGAMGVFVAVAVVGPGLLILDGGIPAWPLAALVGLGLGAILGPRSWRPAAALTVAGTGILLLAGSFLS